jgi:hypothetical protein
MSLSELLERVKAASGPDREIDMAIAREFDLFETLMGDRRFMRPFYFTASIDAAVALIERALPEANCHGYDAGPNGVSAYVSRNNIAVGHWSFETKGATPALALVAALLKAKIAEDKQ